MYFAGHAAGSMRRKRCFAAWGLVTSLLTSMLSSAGPIPVASASVATVKDLTTAFVTALNTKDGRLLASLYADSPALLCTDLDILVANQLFGHEEGGLVLNRLEKSRATITPPGVAAAPNGNSIVVFSATWIYRIPGDDEDRILHAEITWIIQRGENAYRIVDQKTKPLDPDSFGC
jgi:hypothetical protein